MKTHQPLWKLVAQLGDAHPLDYGGLFVYEDQSGVYPPECAKLVPPEDSEADSPVAKWTEYRFILEPCTFINGILSDNKFHPEHPAWFADSLESVASFIGQSKADLIVALVDGSAKDKAWAWESISEYHGFGNLDSYPLTLTRAEVEARYPRETWRV